jgi:hypothetical protein
MACSLLHRRDDRGREADFSSQVRGHILWGYFGEYPRLNLQKGGQLFPKRVELGQPQLQAAK